MDDVVASRFSCRWARGVDHHQEERLGVAADMTSRVVMVAWGMDIGQATADPAAIASSLSVAFQQERRLAWGDGALCCSAFRPLCLSPEVVQGTG